MKREIFIIIIISLVGIHTRAQIPYFSKTVGNNRLYGYTSIKCRPGINSQETYTTFQYGLGNYFAAGLDLYTYDNNSYTGFLIRSGIQFNKWFGIGFQATPSFDLNDNFKFSYLTGGLYLNGCINNTGKFFWCSNTWLSINHETADTYMNWEYLGMNIPVGKSHNISLMAGTIHSWKFNQDIDIAIGMYYSINNWNFYLWSNDLLKTNPRLVLGFDFMY